MKLVRRISFLLILSGIMLGLGGYGALKAEEFFYPHKYQDKEARVPAKQITQTAQKEEMEEQVIEAAVEDRPVVTADTLYLVEQVDLNKGTVTEREETVPVMYIGLNREELLEALSAYDKNPPLSEQEQGFETVELTSFSADRVVVCKYYKEKVPRGFYLMVADHFIVVYEEDRNTLYMNTDILLSLLPESLQTEIMEGKYVASEEELYLFLESYSS